MRPPEGTSGSFTRLCWNAKPSWIVGVDRRQSGDGDLRDSWYGVPESVRCARVGEVLKSLNRVQDAGLALDELTSDIAVVN